MLNLPIVKFEKSCNYLNEQLTLQNNNKQLILDIISNIGLILNDSTEKLDQYDNILETANEFLKTLSANILSIEQLNLEIQNITAELTSLLSEQNKTSKTKEFYIAAFSNIKHNIIVYSKKFQELENTLAVDNAKFNEFINENNFKYNFVSIDNSTNTYTFTGFSMNDIEEISNESINNTEDSTSVEELSDNNIVENIEENDIETVENIEEAVNENVENIEENINETEEDIENFDETCNLENNTEINVSITNNIDEIIPTKFENIDKIEELTNEFKSLLLNISETNINDATSSVISLFKELLPQESNTSFEDFIKLKSDSEKNTDNLLEENKESEFVLDAFDSIKLIDDFIVEDFETMIFEENSGLIYEFDEELEKFISYKEDFSISPLPQENKSEVEIIEENSEDTISSQDTDILLLDSLLEASNCLNSESILEELNNLENLLDANPQLEENVSQEDTIIDSIEILDNNISIEEEAIDSTIEVLDNNISIEDETIDSAIEVLDNNISIEDEILDSTTSSQPEFENADELFVEDSTDIDEEVENVEDIEILIDNIETIENVEKSIFEELNSNSSLLEDISFDNIIENSENNIFDAENSSETNLQENTTNEISSLLSNELVENLLIEDNDFVDNLLNIPTDTELTNDIQPIEPNINNDFEINSDEISLEDFDLLNDIDILDNTILESELSIEEDSDTLTSTEQSPEEESKNIEHFYKDENSKDETIKNKILSKKDFDNKLLKIENAIEDNRTLVISERLQKIYLPYKVSELTNYVESYPGSYNSLKDVVAQEFILPFDYFRKHPSKSRFTEAYNLLKNREGRNFMKSVSYAFRLLNKNNLNPAIIASCKTQHELDSYLYYLDSDNLNNFKFFDIIYEVNPM